MSAEIAPPSATRDVVISVQNVTKTYAGGGRKALDGINLEIRRGEIFALLGNNGAGKTTLISIICGIVNASSGKILADGHDILSDYRAARTKIGLVPQELTSDVFEKVWATVRFSRELFGKSPDDAYLEKVLRDLSLWDRKNSKIITLSGGMKRRVMIAKALAHQPEILFLDEPTAGVDVELRRDMWEMVHRLREDGVTIILTTHYIEEAEQMADRIGVIDQGKIVIVDDKTTLMKKMGKKQLILILAEPLTSLPPELQQEKLELSEDGSQLIYTFDPQAAHNSIAELLSKLAAEGVSFTDLKTQESSLEDIFVGLVSHKA